MRTAFPVSALPEILPLLADDLPSLLSACCVSKDWRDEAHGNAVLWQNIFIPRKLQTKVTDERSAPIIKRSGDLGPRQVELSRCTKITDKSVRAITEALTSLPEALYFDHCSKVTWRSVCPLAKRLLELLDEKAERSGTGDDESSLEDGDVIECDMPFFGVAGINWKGCPADVFEECFVDSPLAHEIDDVRICEHCDEVEGIPICSFCDRGIQLADGGCARLDLSTCEACQRSGCHDHFTTPSIDSYICYQCAGIEFF